MDIRILKKRSNPKEKALKNRALQRYDFISATGL
jgi:hypothetical protein